MEIFRAGFGRRMLRQVHLWIGLGLGALLAPIGLTGALLVFDVEIDRWFDPARYAVTGSEVLQSADVYLANAGKAVAGAQAASLRWPATPGAPITVLLRGGEGEGPSAASRLRMAYLDPPTGRVLGVADFRGSLIGVIHSLHANLMAPDFSGRQIVGWVGLGLATMVVSGVWLWWPRAAAFLQALWWRRGAKVSVNLHHVLGIWIAGPLLVMALTGAYLSFPQQARGLIGFFAEMSPRPQRQGPGAALLRHPAQDPQRVLEIALQAGQGLRPTALSFPTAQDKAWRVQLVNADGEPRAALVDDATAAVAMAPLPAPGDAFGAWLRRVHEATHHGALWRAIGFFCGFCPTILLVTGVIMWLRRRGGRAAQVRLDATVRRLPVSRARRRERQKTTSGGLAPVASHRRRGSERL